MKKYIILYSFLAVMLIGTLALMPGRTETKTNKEPINVTVKEFDKDKKEIIGTDGRSFSKVEGINYDNLKSGFRLALEHRRTYSVTTFKRDLVKDEYVVISAKEVDENISSIEVEVKDYRIDENNNTVIKDSKDKEYVLQNVGEPLRPEKNIKITLYHNNDEEIYHITNNF